MQNLEPDDFGEIERTNEDWQRWAQNQLAGPGSVTERLFAGRLPEWWELEAQPFEGAWLLQDMSTESDEETLAVCMGRLLVFGIAHRYIRQGLRAEDGVEDVDVVKEYLDVLSLPPNHARPLYALLSALHPFDASAASDALLAIAWAARGHQQDYAVRCSALLAYDCARAAGLNDLAAGAARALADTALRQECRRSARRWSGRAFIHERRALS